MSGGFGLGRAIGILLALLAGCARVEEGPALVVTVVDGGGNAVDDVWGSWRVDPGARNVAPSTFLRLEGAGAWLVRLVGGAAYGVEDPAWSVPFHANVDVGVAYAAEPPDLSAFTWTEAATEAPVALPPEGAVAIVAYRLHRVPIPLEAQEYRAPYEIVRSP